MRRRHDGAAPNHVCIRFKLWINFNPRLQSAARDNAEAIAEHIAPPPAVLRKTPFHNLIKFLEPPLLSPYLGRTGRFPIAF